MSIGGPQPPSVRAGRFTAVMSGNSKSKRGERGAEASVNWDLAWSQIVVQPAHIPELIAEFCLPVTHEEHPVVIDACAFTYGSGAFSFPQFAHAEDDLERILGGVVAVVPIGQWDRAGEAEIHGSVGDVGFRVFRLADESALPALCDSKATEWAGRLALQRELIRPLLSMPGVTTALSIRGPRKRHRHGKMHVLVRVIGVELETKVEDVNALLPHLEVLDIYREDHGPLSGVYNVVLAHPRRRGGCA